MTAPTPGPWTFRPGRYGSPHVISWAPGKTYGQIALIGTPSFAELPEAKLADEVEANARLIAAAPELLKVARELESVGRTVGDLLCTPGACTKEELVNIITLSGSTARKAIAKAEEGN